MDYKIPFSVMAFANGPDCNLNCDYCYYNNENNIYNNNDDFKMDLETLEIFIKKYIKSQPGPVVEFIWQGGECTLRGLDFFKKAVELQYKYLPKKWQVNNTIQTNGINLNKQWFDFILENKILIGLSLDGDEEIHDSHRRDFNNRGSYSRAVKTLSKLQQYQIPYNILTVVNKTNVKQAERIYYHFKNLNIKYMQFIPLVNKADTNKKNGNQNMVSSLSITGAEFGEFLITLFDQWIKDFGDIYIQIFAETLNAYFGGKTNICVFSQLCGRSPVIDHLGDLYSCDHFVESKYRLGNIKSNSFEAMITSDKQKNFAFKKRTGLTNRCKKCKYLFICNGGCPKNRILDIGEEKMHNFLCNGYYNFFTYSEDLLLKIKDFIQQGMNYRKIKEKLSSK
ncbi:MAG: anaerobic sulfatase maturase [Bacillota bacterium]